MGKISQNKKKIAIVIVIIVVSIIYYFYDKNENSNSIEKINNISNDNNEKINSDKSTEKIIVHISGAVNSPGVIELEEGLRVKDAIELANGLKDNADLTNINLAEKVVDECKIYIPEKKDNDSENNNEKINYDQKSNEVKKSVNINTANIAELQTLPGIGQATAEKIIEYRKKNGKFSKIEDIKNVRGIGEAKFEDLKEYINV